MNSAYFSLANEISEAFSRLPQVQAIALGGSLSNAQSASDQASDIDLYVFTQGEIPVSDRQAIMEKTGGASAANIGLNYWGPGDEWFHRPTGIEVDMVYFNQRWMEEQIDKVVFQHVPAMGYTTCFWFTLMNCVPLVDPQQWLTHLRKRCDIAYPEELRRAIVNFNYPVLRTIIPAYGHQLEKAVNRGDLVSVNHRLAALLASYFDILFAVNRQLHPGEKRLLQQALTRCNDLPQALAIDLNKIFAANSSTLSEFPLAVNSLLDHLDEWLKKQNLLE